MHGNRLQAVRETELLADQQLFEKEVLGDLLRVAGLVRTEEFHMQEQHWRPARDQFADLTRSAQETLVASELIDALWGKVVFQKLEHCGRGGSQF